MREPPINGRASQPYHGTTFNEVSMRLHTASDIARLEAAAAFIDRVVDSEYRSILSSIYRQRRAELESKT